MDGERFDHFTRTLAHRVSRRSVVRGITTLLAGSALAARPLSGKAAPNPCNVYCAGESGPRGAQCRQACKACGGPDSNGFCFDPLVRGYSCCPSGLTCFDTWSYPGGETVVCCTSGEQVCNDAGSPMCCASGSYCADVSLCCPIGIGTCNDPETERMVCGSSCYDHCTFRHICGDPDDNGNCAATSCYNPCTQGAECGPADEQGNCSVETCYDVCSLQTYCAPANDRGNCFNSYFNCYDPCNNVDLCEPPDPYGNCFQNTCYDPVQGTTVCGTECSDLCNFAEVRCGSSAGNEFGVCDDNACRASSGAYSCGPADDDGACIV